MSWHSVVLTIALFAFSVTGVHGGIWRQTDWSGGDGQELWSDSSRYLESEGVTPWVDSTGDLHLQYWRDTGFDFSEVTTNVYDLICTYDGSLYAGIYGGDVYRSTDGGDSWHLTGELEGMERVCALIQASDSTLYAAGGVDNWPFSAYAAVFKSTDLGTSWHETGNIGHNMISVLTIIEASDSTLYLGAVNTSISKAMVLKSTNGGTNWDATAALPDVYFIGPILEDFERTIYVCAAIGTDYQLFKSFDEGASWDSSGALPPGGGGAYPRDRFGSLYQCLFESHSLVN